MDPTLDRWLDAIKVALSTAVVALAFATATGDPWIVGGAVAGGLVASWVVSPLSVVGRHTAHGDAIAAAGGHDDLVVYWRPGCSVAVSLLTRLTRDQRDAVTWVNVVRDPEAAAFVRSHRGGDMVTPTVVDGTGALVEPTADAVRARLAPDAGGDRRT